MSPTTVPDLCHQRHMEASLCHGSPSHQDRKRAQLDQSLSRADMAALKGRSISPLSSKATEAVPCLTGNPHTAHQRTVSERDETFGRPRDLWVMIRRKDISERRVVV
jgi:hypothetical protein